MFPLTANRSRHCEGSVFRNHQPRFPMQKTNEPMLDEEHDTGRNPVYLHDLLGMELIAAEHGEAKARLHVHEKVCQPFGFLSGGASLALAETLAGYGALTLCSSGEVPFGIQVSANHVHAVPMGGTVTATASLLQKSRHIHVWNVDIVDEEGRLASSCRVTNCIKERKPS